MIKYIHRQQEGYPQRNMGWITQASGLFIPHEELHTLQFWDRVTIHKSGVYDYSKQGLTSIEGATAKVISRYPEVRLKVIYLTDELPSYVSTIKLILSKIDNYSFLNPQWLYNDGSQVHYFSISRCRSNLIIKS